MTKQVKNLGFNASLLQVRRAYYAMYGRHMSDKLPYAEAAQRIIDECGYEKGKEYIQSISNNTNSELWSKYGL